MKKLENEKMEVLTGGDNRKKVTGVMCGMAIVLLCSVAFAPLAAAPGIGCAIGLYAINK